MCAHNSFSSLPKFAATVLYAALALPLFSVSALAKVSYTTIDVPGAQFTESLSINQLGDVAGAYLSSDFQVQGFARFANGSFLTIDYPNAIAYSINDNGDVAGSYSDSLTHGWFVRKSDGILTSFDPPDGQILEVTQINNAGTIVGDYMDGEGYTHGFLLEPSGAFTAFDAPNASATYGHGINNKGVVVGGFTTDEGAHGFTRNTAGQFTVFDVSGSNSTSASSINDKGQVAGSAFTDQWHGFVRGTDGVITTFDATGSTATLAFDINSKGTIVGSYSKANEATTHGFVRQRGKVKSFDVPNSLQTDASSVNNTGAITGTFLDNASVAHGFLRVKVTR